MVLGLFIAMSSDCVTGESGETVAPTGKLFSSSECPGTFDVGAALAGPEPLFVSDYFSFVGADEKGHVAFAIDNDRARRGKKFSADSHVVLHDEREGWIRVSGAGGYENKKRELLTIPDSPDFQLVGEAKSGITFHSLKNKLELVVAPVHERDCRISGEAVYSMGSTSAILKWRGRIIPGRVI